MIRLFDFSDRDLSISLVDTWVKLVMDAKKDHTLIRCELIAMHDNAYIVRSHGRQIESTDSIGSGGEIRYITSMARKRGWAVDIFTADPRNMYEEIRRRIECIITPTKDPDKFVLKPNGDNRGSTDTW